MHRRLRHPQRPRRSSPARAGAPRRGLAQAGRRPPSPTAPSPPSTAASSSSVTEDDLRRVPSRLARTRVVLDAGGRHGPARFRRSPHPRRLRRRPARGTAPPAGRRHLRRDRRSGRRHPQHGARDARGLRGRPGGVGLPSPRRDAAMRHDDRRGEERLRPRDGVGAEDAARHPAPRGEPADRPGRHLPRRPRDPSRSTATGAHAYVDLLVERDDPGRRGGRAGGVVRRVLRNRASSRPRSRARSSVAGARGRPAAADPRRRAGGERRLGRRGRRRRAVGRPPAVRRAGFGRPHGRARASSRRCCRRRRST